MQWWLLRPLLVPIQTEFFAIKGLSMIMDLVKLISEDLNQDLKLRYLLTMYDARTNLSKEVVKRCVNFSGTYSRSSYPEALYSP